MYCLKRACLVKTAGDNDDFLLSLDRSKVFPSSRRSSAACGPVAVFNSSSLFDGMYYMQAVWPKSCMLRKVTVMKNITTRGKLTTIRYLRK